MKLHFSRSMVGALAVFAGVGIPAWHKASAVTLSVSPPAVSTAYTGGITLQIGGVTNGEVVRVKKFLDGNTNGMVDANDVLVQSFQLTDGQAVVIGGVTNLNVPGDATPPDGVIQTSLNFQAGGVGQALAGQYAYVVSSPTGSFPSVTNLFSVTNSAQAQAFTGTVRCSGSNVPYASVMLFTPPTYGGGGGMDFVAGAVADSSGGYRVAAPVGTYMLFAARAGYVTDFFTAPVLPLGSGATVNTNLSLVAATQTISGRVVDSANTNQGISGLMVRCQSINEQFLAIGFTGTNGSFTVPVIAAQWRPAADEKQSAFYGYLQLRDQTNSVDTTTGNVAGVSIALPRSTALIYGSVRDELNNPLAGVGIRGSQDNGSGPYQSDAVTDLNGNYTLGVLAGNWQASLDNVPNYIFNQMSSTNFSVGQARLQNFILVVATNHITGLAVNGAGTPLTNLDVYARATIGTNTFNTYTQTGTNGTYSLNVANGTWYVGVNCSYLSGLGLECPGETSTNILNANAVVNFVASDLQITTTNLPSGTVGVFYSQSLAASGGQTPYTWALAPTSPSFPTGLSLSTNGVLSGTPTGSSGFSVTVRVTDHLGATADMMLGLNINPAPLLITTTNLPAGTNGQYYSQTLAVTGGNPPYNWYLPNGALNLPPGLNLSTNGDISGTPTTNGVFNFNVAVSVANPYQATTLALSLTIAALPVDITTTSPLPGATRGSFYTTTLAATGGQSPYAWTLAPASPSLPAGLALSPGGVLSGTPTGSGDFSFTVRVTDFNSATHDKSLALSISEPVASGTTLTGVTRPGLGQFQFSFNAGWGTNYTIQYSDDLQTWISVLTIGGPGGPLTIVDPNATASQRFYRVKVGP